ncbi:CLUMA_CG011139, isoform A [Clunio marinus]|uniref:Ell-associated factor Eaf n=1 Tax=Clunio marinus TaxID=568069 RepID=A0A1J1IBV0_9DIPT|nr:CLUMA_CG011139, isoform A [Clunio marinus]
MDRGQEVRELKLGASFASSNARTVYHTLKYDFKPASVDVHKEATLQTGSNNSVTVTLPHLDGSGVPNTIFKGNQRDYTKKECVLIINRDTNEIILERLNSQILVKKTRADNSNKQTSLSNNSSAPSIANKSDTSQTNFTPKVENQTARHSSKTRVSTGLRKNNILNFVPKHSPLQGSPSYAHRSPQQAPLWNANNPQQTLPSIPSLLDENFSNNSQPPPSSGYNNKNNNNNPNTNISLSNQSASTSASGAILQQQQQQQSLALDDIGELSSSSSSDSNDDESDSDSDSADSSTNNATNICNNVNNNTIMANNVLNQKKAPTSSNLNNHLDNSAAILRKDLCLSDSNSDSDY